MTPSFTISNPTDGCPGNAQLSCQRCHGSTSIKTSTGVADSVIVEFGRSVRFTSPQKFGVFADKSAIAACDQFGVKIGVVVFAARRSPLRCFVLHVGRLVAQEQMRDADTGREVTLMETEQAIGNRAVLKLPRRAVGFKAGRTSATATDMTIASAIVRALPDPARAKFRAVCWYRSCLIDLRPETVSKRSGVTLPAREGTGVPSASDAARVSSVNRAASIASQGDRVVAHDDLPVVVPRSGMSQASPEHCIVHQLYQRKGFRMTSATPDKRPDTVPTPTPPPTRPDGERPPTYVPPAPAPQPDITKEREAEVLRRQQEQAADPLLPPEELPARR